VIASDVRIVVGAVAVGTRSASPDWRLSRRSSIRLVLDGRPPWFRAVAGPPYAPAAVEALLAEIDDAQGGRMSADR
jgi:hypothetical protein